MSSIQGRKINCVIVDDNKVALTLLKQHLSKIDNINVVAECLNAKDAKTIIDKEEVDLLFLDIEMPEMSGLDLLRILKTRPLTILTTAKQAYAVEAFELNVVDYIVKPFNFSRLVSAIERATELLHNSETQLTTEAITDYLFIKESKVIRKILLDDILWLESKGDYVKLTLPEKHYIIHGSLKTFEEKLPESKFLRVHRSYIIAINKIDYIEERLVYVHNTPIPISDSYRQSLLSKLNLL